MSMVSSLLHYLPGHVMKCFVAERLHLDYQRHHSHSPVNLAFHPFRGSCPILEGSFEEQVQEQTRGLDADMIIEVEF